MNNRVFKRVLAIGLIFTMVIASMVMLAFGASAEHVYSNNEEKQFYLKSNNAHAGSLIVNDAYYRDSRCLYIHDTVTYTSNAISPYNVVLSGLYSFEYTNGTSNGKSFDRVANRNGYEFNMAVQSSGTSVLHIFTVMHYINYVNPVSIYTDNYAVTSFTVY